jgi:hypothetical protein
MMTGGGKSLLSIVELGGYPDFTPLYKKLGFEVIHANSLRKALSAIKKQHPDVVVAEFIYGPTYGSQLSNFESLFAALQQHSPSAKLIALLDKKDTAHFDRLKARFAVYGVVYFPVAEGKLRTVLKGT